MLVEYLWLVMSLNMGLMEYEQSFFVLFVVVLNLFLAVFIFKLNVILEVISAAPLDINFLTGVRSGSMNVFSPELLKEGVEYVSMLSLLFASISANLCRMVARSIVSLLRVLLSFSFLLINLSLRLFPILGLLMSLRWPGISDINMLVPSHLRLLMMEDMLAYISRKISFCLLEFLIVVYSVIFLIAVALSENICAFVVGGRSMSANSIACNSA